MCPAVMFAKRRIESANGLMNIPIISIGIITIFIGQGNPGIQKMCCQYVLFAVNCVIKNVNIAKAAVTAIFPVTLIPNGNNPKIFKNKIKKKIVSN